MTAVRLVLACGCVLDVIPGGGRRIDGLALGDSLWCISHQRAALVVETVGTPAA